jgi:hypothetical protein
VGDTVETAGIFLESCSDKEGLCKTKSHLNLPKLVFKIFRSFLDTFEVMSTVVLKPHRSTTNSEALQVEFELKMPQSDGLTTFESSAKMKFLVNCHEVIEETV